MSEAKNDVHEAGGKPKREEHERERARLHEYRVADISLADWGRREIAIDRLR